MCPVSNCLSHYSPPPPPYKFSESIPAAVSVSFAQEMKIPILLFILGVDERVWDRDYPCCKLQYSEYKHAVGYLHDITLE